MLDVKACVNWLSAGGFPHIQPTEPNFHSLHLGWWVWIFHTVLLFTGRNSRRRFAQTVFKGHLHINCTEEYTAHIALTLSPTRICALPILFSANTSNSQLIEFTKLQCAWMIQNGIAREIFEQTSWQIMYMSTREKQLFCKHAFQIDEVDLSRYSAKDKLIALCCVNNKKSLI